MKNNVRLCCCAVKDLRGGKIFLLCIPLQKKKFNQRIYIASIVIGNGCANDFDELLVPHSPIWLDAGLAKDLVNCKRVKL